MICFGFRVLVFGFHDMLIVFTGNGKGKTTAALGQAIRALGEGKRVLMIQFIKGPWVAGEHMFADKFQVPNDKFQIVRTGKGFVGIMGDALPFEEHKKAAEDGFALAEREIASGEWDIVILDEINNAVSLGLLSKEKVLSLIDSVTSVQYPVASNQLLITNNQLQPINNQLPVTVILTGRDAPQEFIGRADLVTEMRDVKHPYEKGVKAKRGIEY